MTYAYLYINTSAVLFIETANFLTKFSLLLMHSLHYYSYCQCFSFWQIHGLLNIISTDPISLNSNFVNYWFYLLQRKLEENNVFLQSVFKIAKKLISSGIQHHQTHPSKQRTGVHSLSEILLINLWKSKL